MFGSSLLTHSRSRAAAFVLSVCLLTAASSGCRDDSSSTASAGTDDPATPFTASPASPNPIEGLARLVGGAWYLEDDSFQTYEWGVGRQLIQTKGYFVTGGVPDLVAEGIWYFHPADQELRAYGVALDMPMVSWEYVTTASGDELQHALTTFAADGAATEYREVWTFTDDDHYEWSLLERSDADWVPVSGGLFERRSVPESLVPTPSGSRELQREPCGDHALGIPSVPPDFSVGTTYANGTVAGTFRWDYEIRVGPGLCGWMAVWTGYDRTPGNTNVREFEVTNEQLLGLWTAVSEADLGAAIELDVGEIPVGGSPRVVDFTRDGETIRATQWTQAPWGRRVEDLATTLAAMVPEQIWQSVTAESAVDILR